MATKYLDANGLLYLWQKIRNTFVSDITWDSTNKKLIRKKKTGANGAEESVDLVSFATVATSGSYEDLSNKPTIPTLKNVFGKVKVGNSTIEADTTQDTLELVAGSNVTLTPDTTNDKVTIAATDTTYSIVSAYADGLMSSLDKTRLDLLKTPSEIEDDYQKSSLHLVVSGSTATLKNNSETVTISFTSAVAFYTYGFEKIYAEVISSSGNIPTESRTFDITYVNATTQNIILTCVNNGIVYTANLTDNGSGLTGTYSTRTIATKVSDLTNDSGFITSYTDTKNTAGSTDTSSKIFIVGATSQAANPQTYSQDTAYVGTDGHLYSDSKQVVNLSGSQSLTNKTYNGYTLGAACAKDVVTSISSDSNDVPTVTAVKNYIASTVTGAVAFQGTAPTTFAPTNYKAGYYWVIGTAGTYAGQTCEAGDMIFAINDYVSAYSASDFDVVQTNLDITSISNAEIDVIVAS